MNEYMCLWLCVFGLVYAVCVYANMSLSAVMLGCGHDR